MVETLEPEPETDAPSPPPSAVGPLFEWCAALLALGVVAGAYLDGWAHNHGRVDESFFTPWHGILYGTVALAGLFFGGAVAHGLSRGVTGRDALPPAYRVSLLGVVLFGVAGVADLVWHSIFGIEVDIESLISPTHLLLAAAGVLIASGPLGHAWRRGAGVDGGWRSRGPAIVALASVIAILGFMTQFTHPVVEAMASVNGGRPEPLSDVHVMNADGSAQTRLTIDSDRWQGQPAWAPDGRTAVVSSAVRNQPADLYRLNLDGGGETRLTSAPGTEFSPAWSPDGTKIAYVASPRVETGSERSNLYVMNADGSDPRRLTDTAGAEWHPSWSPDGGRIAFSTRDGGGWRLYVVDAAGGQPDRITDGPDDVGAAWSPDGSAIAFGRFEGDASHVYLVAPDGSGLRRLAGTGQDLEPSWSPRGDQIAFVSRAEGLGQVYVMSADGSNARNLSRNPGLYHGLPAWSPDGTRILYEAAAFSEPPGFLLDQRLGVSSIVVQTMLLVGPILLVASRWRLPFGAVTLVLLLTAATSAVLLDTYELIPGIALAGVAGDVLLIRLRPDTSPRDLRLFAVALPLLYYGGYFADLALTEGLAWSVHLWSGAMALAAITGLLLSLLLTLGKRDESGIRI